jgi:hypothetical protein
LLVGPVSVTTIRLPIRADEVGPLALAATLLAATIAILLAAASGSMVTDRVADYGAKQAAFRRRAG